MKNIINLATNLIKHYFLVFLFLISESESERPATDEEITFMGKAVAELLSKRNPQWEEVELAMDITADDRKDLVLNETVLSSNIKTKIRNILQKVPCFKHVNVVSKLMF